MDAVEFRMEHSKDTDPVSIRAMTYGHRKPYSGTQYYIQLEKERKMQKKILELIENYMEDNAISKANLARKCCYTPQAMYAWFSGRNRLTLEVLDEILNALGLKMEVKLKKK